MGVHLLFIIVFAKTCPKLDSGWNLPIIIPVGNNMVMAHFHVLIFTDLFMIQAIALYYFFSLTQWKIRIKAPG